MRNSSSAVGSTSLPTSACNVGFCANRSPAAMTERSYASNCVMGTSHGISYPLRVRSIVWMASSQPRVVERLAPSPVVVRSAQEFIAAPRDAKTISFLDDAALAVLDESAAQFAAE